ncbi:MAG: hypothetical protein JXA21_06820 [Anaerolineae bacterium]|nr:hypothetical protein [Anaerolineae bacterium]
MSTFDHKSTALFIPCTVDGYDRNTGSALIRAHWIAKYWPGAAVYNGEQALSEWDLILFQKAYLSVWSQSIIDRLAALRNQKGAPTLVLDLCDPDFLGEEHRRRLLDVLPAFDFATAPTQPLVDWLGQYLPAYLVPDTFDPEAITTYHGFEWAGRPRCCWIGYHTNRAALSPALLDVVRRFGLELDIIDVDRPVPFADWLQMLTQYDVLLNPRPDWGKYRYKSNNKSIIAWAAGVAVAETAEDLRALADPEWHSGWIIYRLEELNLELYHAYYATAALYAAYRDYKEVYNASSGLQSR